MSEPTKPCDCGYKIDFYNVVTVVRCPLHDAAPEMLDALRVALEHFYNPGKFIPLGIERQLTAAIRKAEEGTEQGG